MTTYGSAEDADPRFVYTFWTAVDECLYVGCTVDFSRRLVAHKRDRPWWDQVTRIDVDIYPDFTSGATAESERIRRLNPTHNRALTTHDTPRQNPCRRCRRAAHSDCLGVNRDGDPCHCSVCARNRIPA